MKTLVIVLAAAVLILCGVLLMNNRAAEKQHAKAVADIATLSNKVTEVTTRLVLEGVKASEAQNAAQSNLTHCLRQTATATQTLAQIKTQLASTQSRLQNAQTELAARHAQIESLQARLAAAQASVQTLDTKARQLADSHQRLVATQQKLSGLNEAFGNLRLQHATLSAQILDPDFLRHQTEKVRELARLRQRQAGAKPGTPPDPRAPLVLQPDGSVRVASQTNGNP
ncbi:MAG: hypothetical protein JXQ71_06890 [Verrucomicrobia bacterium]|nr:hypothetical protein [Verrucomicrobiota bacterium]